MFSDADRRLFTIVKIDFADILTEVSSLIEKEGVNIELQDEVHLAWFFHSS